MTSTFRYGETLRVNGILLHYLRYGGSGEPMIIIPGIISPAAVWSFVGEYIGKTRDCFIIDVRGRGLSSSGNGIDYGIDVCATDVLELADAVALKSFVLLGHSMGARIAIRAASRGHKELSRVVLVDPPVGGPGRRPYPIPLDKILDTLEQGSNGMMSDSFNKSQKWNETARRARAEWLHTCDFASVVTAHRGFQEDDIHSDLPRIAVPVALMTAGDGGTVRPEDIEEFRQLVPGIAVETLHGIGHMIPFEDPERFHESLDRLLKPVLSNGIQS